MDMKLQKELEHLINKFSRENESDTPDFILAEYIMGCLGAYETAVNARGKWYGHKTLSKDFKMEKEPYELSIGLFPPMEKQ